MEKACCAPGCVNRFSKGSGIKFYRFPVDPERRRRWITALNRKEWQPSEYSLAWPDRFFPFFFEVAEKRVWSGLQSLLVLTPSKC